MKKYFLAVLLMGLSAVHAQTEVPNTFQSGTPARASEVNENFDALEDAIDSNALAITQIPAGPEGPPGPQGPRGVQGPEGPQGPPGADLSEEVSILQGEQTVQNDRIDQIESDQQRNADAIDSNTNALNDLASASDIQVYSQGTPIGKFLQLDEQPTTRSPRITLISSTGYLFRVFSSPDSDDSLTKNLWFSDRDCQGTAMTGLTPSEAWLGLAFKVIGPIPAYYAPRGSVLQTMDYRSEYFFSNGNYFCTNTADVYSRQNLVVVYPNDVAVTGVPDAHLEPAQPLSIGAP